MTSPHTRTHAPATPATVLIVDDEPSIREFLAFALSNQGFRIITASDGEEALRVVAQESPDLVLTDLMMPRMDGYQLIERIRRQRRPVGAIMIIAMSAVSIASAHPPAANLFLSKPFEVDQLVASVRSLLASPPSVANVV